MAPVTCKEWSQRNTMSPLAPPVSTKRPSALAAAAARRSVPSADTCAHESKHFTTAYRTAPDMYYRLLTHVVSAGHEVPAVAVWDIHASFAARQWHAFTPGGAR